MARTKKHLALRIGFPASDEEGPCFSALKAPADRVKPSKYSFPSPLVLVVCVTPGVSQRHSQKPSQVRFSDGTKTSGVINEVNQLSVRD
jgi:hypothetical protein